MKLVLLGETRIWSFLELWELNYFIAKTFIFKSIILTLFFLWKYSQKYSTSPRKTFCSFKNEFKVFHSIYIIFIYLTLNLSLVTYFYVNNLSAFDYVAKNKIILPFNPFTPKCVNTQNWKKKKIPNFILKGMEKQTVPHESTAQQLSFEWSHTRVSCTDLKVRNVQNNWLDACFWEWNG